MQNSCHYQMKIDSDHLIHVDDLNDHETTPSVLIAQQNKTINYITRASSIMQTYYLITNYQSAAFYIIAYY